MKKRIVPTAIALIYLIGACSSVGPRTHVQPTVPLQRTATYLPRPTIVDGQSPSFSTSLLVQQDSSGKYWVPRDLSEAIVEMQQMLPLLSSEAALVAERRSCKPADSTQGAWQLSCEASLCHRLPDDSQDSSCSYFASLDTWIQEAWLGFNCHDSRFTPNTALAKWFATKGISNCFSMSETITSAYLLTITEQAPDLDRLTEQYRQRNLPPRQH